MSNSNIKILAVCIDTKPDISEFSEYMKFLPEKRKQKITRLIRNDDKIMSLFTGLIMLYGISRDNSVNINDIELVYGKYGKPLLKNRTDYFFSVSNTKNLVVFTSSDSAVGIDAEPLRNADKFTSSISRRYFTEAENEFIKNHEATGFWQIWTSKEAYIKLTGEGLSVPLNSFDVTVQNINHKYISTVCFNNMITVCCPHKYQHADICMLNTNDLLFYFK